MASRGHQATNKTIYLALKNLPSQARLADIVALYRGAGVSVDPASIAVAFERLSPRQFLLPLRDEVVLTLLKQAPHFCWNNFHVRSVEISQSSYRDAHRVCIPLRAPGTVLVWPLPAGDEKAVLADLLAGFRVASPEAARSRQGLIPFSIVATDSVHEMLDLCAAAVQLRSPDEALTFVRERDGASVRHKDGSSKVIRVMLSPLAWPTSDVTLRDPAASRDAIAQSLPGELLS